MNQAMIAGRKNSNTEMFELISKKLKSHIFKDDRAFIEYLNSQEKHAERQAAE